MGDAQVAKGVIRTSQPTGANRTQIDIAPLLAVLDDPEPTLPAMLSETDCKLVAEQPPVNNLFRVVKVSTLRPRLDVRMANPKPTPEIKKRAQPDASMGPPPPRAPKAARLTVTATPVVVSKHIDLTAHEKFHEPNVGLSDLFDSKPTLPIEAPKCSMKDLYEMNIFEAIAGSRSQLV